MSRSPAWHITNGEAGWITGLFYAAYTVSVPILVTLTDRVDPRTVYLGGVALTIAHHLGRYRPETAQGLRSRHAEWHQRGRDEMLERRCVMY